MATTVLTPDARLQSAVPYLTPQGTVADIGTDHAYLPIWLAARGLIRGAVASDINEGPIRTAARNIVQAGLSDRIATLRTDGLHGIEVYLPDDVLIFGMGGELIAKILSEAPWIVTRRVNLILQPMSRANVLRRYLNENGFSIRGETLTRDGERFYQTLCAAAGEPETPYTEEELLLGRRNLETPPACFADFVRHEARVLSAILDGKRKSKNADCSAEERLFADLQTRLEKIS